MPRMRFIIELEPAPTSLDAPVGLTNVGMAQAIARALFNCTDDGLHFFADIDSIRVTPYSPAKDK